MNISQHFQWLTEAAFCDGQIQPEERPVLRSLAERLGLSRAELGHHIARILYKVGSQPKLPIEHREALVENIIRVLVADQRVLPEERRFLMKVGARLGYEESELAEKLAWELPARA